MEKKLHIVLIGTWFVDNTRVTSFAGFDVEGNQPYQLERKLALNMPRNLFREKFAVAELAG